MYINNKKNLINLIILAGFLLIVYLGSISALPTCTVEARSDCVESSIPGAKIVAGLSDLNNAHGELAGGGYDYVLCCNFGTGDISCGANSINKLFGLSSSTNAHAEVPDLASSNYDTYNVCYNGLQNCRSVSGSENHAGDEIELDSKLSANTNAHLGKTSYTTRIFCRPDPATFCEISNPRWSDSETYNGTQVDMTVDGTQACETGTIQISFEILRNGVACTDCLPPTSPVTFGSGSATGTWTAGPASNDNYSFIARVVGTSSELQSPANLHVSEKPAYCIETPPATCQGYNDPINTGEAPSSDCSQNACGLSQQQIENSWDNPSVNCGSGGITCSCQWNAVNSSCNPMWQSGGTPTLTSIDLLPEEASANIGITTDFTVVATYNSGTPVENPAGISCSSSNPGVASKATGSDCSFTANSLGVVTITANYTEGGVTKEDTSILNVTSVITPSHLLLTPATKIILISGEQAYASKVYWSNGSSFLVTSQTIFGSSNTSIANFSGNTATGLRAGRVNITGIYNTGGKVLNGRAFLRVSTGAANEDGLGTCSYNADSSDNCDDGYLSVVWSTLWDGPLGTPEAVLCQNDNGKAETLACPAQIPLPFFNFYNLLAAVAIIATIYIAMHTRKARKR